MTDKRFVGAWRLLTLEIESEDGEVTHPMGPKPGGYIMYTEGGYMSVAISAQKRAGFASDDMGQGTTEEKVAAAETYVSYCGRYEVHDGKVTHDIEVSFFPNWVGTKQTRDFEFDEERLKLSTAPYLVYGKMQTARLVWSRAE